MALFKVALALAALALVCQYSSAWSGWKERKEQLEHELTSMMKKTTGASACDGKYYTMQVITQQTFFVVEKLTSK